MKVNFTKEHLNRMSELLLKMLLENGTIRNRFNQPLTVVDLLHTTTIGTLTEIKQALSKELSRYEEVDEWLGERTTELEQTKMAKELVNLVIGYKRHKLELLDLQKQKEELEEQIQKLEDAQKTPEEKIAELKEKLKNIEL